MRRRGSTREMMRRWLRLSIRTKHHRLHGAIRCLHHMRRTIHVGLRWHALLLLLHHHLLLLLLCLGLSLRLSLGLLLGLSSSGTARPFSRRGRSSTGRGRATFDASPNNSGYILQLSELLSTRLELLLSELFVRYEAGLHARSTAVHGWWWLLIRRHTRWWLRLRDILPVVVDYRPRCT